MSPLTQWRFQENIRWCGECDTFCSRVTSEHIIPFAIPSNFMNYSFNIICPINYYWSVDTEALVAGENGSLKKNLIQIRYPGWWWMDGWVDGVVRELRWQLFAWLSFVTGVAATQHGRDYCSEVLCAWFLCPSSIICINGPIRDAHFGCRAIISESLLLKFGQSDSQVK